VIKEVLSGKLEEKSGSLWRSEGETDLEHNFFRKSG
jgi:hypothetical protein